MSAGERIIGSYNPDGLADVEEMKLKFVMIVNALQRIIEDRSSGETQRSLANQAIVHAVTAQMWAVKATAWKD